MQEYLFLVTSCKIKFFLQHLAILTPSCKILLEYFFARFLQDLGRLTFVLDLGVNVNKIIDKYNWICEDKRKRYFGPLEI